MVDEKQIAEGLINGELKGLVTKGDYVYVPMRLTGTGLVERLDSNGIARIVDRDFGLFSSEEFMKKYSNIPILLMHPQNQNGDFVKAGVGSGVFVGNTIASYLKDEEVWIIARLYEADAINLVSSGELSTSPHFLTSETLREDGIYLETPLEINHLAIVPEGFWDKKSTAPAIEGNSLTLLKEDCMEDQKQDSVICQDVTSSEKVDTITREVQEQVAELQDNEAKEAQKFQELAKQHEKFKEEGVTMSEEKIDKGMEQSETIHEDLATVNKTSDEAKEEVKVETVDKLEEAYDQSETNKSDSEQDTIDDEVIHDDVLTDEDKERDALIEVMHSVADSAKVPHIGAKRFKVTALIKRFARANEEYIPNKFKGFVEKIDSANKELAMDMLNGMIDNIKTSQERKKQSIAGRVGSGLFHTDRFKHI